MTRVWKREAELTTSKNFQDVFFNWDQISNWNKSSSAHPVTWCVQVSVTCCIWQARLWSFSWIGEKKLNLKPWKIRSASHVKTKFSKQQMPFCPTPLGFCHAKKNYTQCKLCTCFALQGRCCYPSGTFCDARARGGGPEGHWECVTTASHGMPFSSHADVIASGIVLHAKSEKSTQPILGYFIISCPTVEHSIWY